MEFTGERMIPEYNHGQEIYLEHMTRYMFASQFVKDKVVLDIACGSGYGTDYLLKAGAKKVIGVDISEETINYCKEKYSDNKLEFLVGSVEKIPAENNSIDIIISFETIEHVNEKEQLKFLQEVKRVLNLDGIFVVSTPNSLIYPKGNKFHLKELNPDEFQKILRKNFKNVEIFYQDDIECSYVYSQKNLENPNNNSGINKKTDTIQALNSMYLVAVCNNEPLGEITEYLGLSKIKMHDVQNYFIGEIKKRDLIIHQKDQEIQRKDQEINFIKSSKFWKLREAYIKYRAKMLFVLFSPKKFIRKYFNL